MKSSLWKLTALAGVVGVVFLAFLQAQRGLNAPREEEFVPAEGEEFVPVGGTEPSSSSGSFAAVEDAVLRSEGESDLDIAAWHTEPPATNGNAAGRAGELDEMTPIRRREGRVRSAATRDSFEGFDTAAPAILQVSDEQLEPIPSADDEFGPDLFESDADDPEPIDRGGRPGRSSGGPFFDDRPEKAPPVLLEPEEDDDFPTFGPSFADEPGTPNADESAVDGFPDDGFPTDDREPRRDVEMSADDGLGGDFPPLGDDFPPLEDDFPSAGDELPPGGDDFPPIEDDFPPLGDDFPPAGGRGEPTFGGEFDDQPRPEAVPIDRAFGAEAPSLGEMPLDDDSLDEPAEPGSSGAAVPFLDAEPDGPVGGGPAAVDSLPSLDATEPEPKLVAPPNDATEIEPERIEKNELIGDGVVADGTPVTPQRPRLTIEKIAPENAVLGQPLVYTIVLKNVGETPARQIVVEDRIPRGTELTGTIPRAELLDKTLRWKFGTLEPGATRKIAVRVTPIAEGQVGSIATVNFVAEVAARTRVTSPSVEFDTSAPSKARLGKPVLLEFNVENKGTNAVSGVVLRNLVPAGLSHPGGDDLEYTVGDLAAGESKVVRLSLTAVQVGQVVNRAIITADGGVRVESKATVAIVGSDLVVSRTGPSKRYVGRTAIFSNVVANNGEVPLAGVTVVENLPRELEFVEAASDGQYDPNRHEVAWRLDRLGPKESRVLKVKLRPKSPGRFTCQVTATTSTGQKASTESVAEALGYASLGLDVEGGGPPAFVGDTVTFTISPVNRGTTNASNVQLVIETSPELELVAVNAPTKYEQLGGRITFAPMPDLGGRTTADYELEFRAVEPGDGRIRASVDADDLTKPIQQDEVIRIVTETPAP